MQTFFDAMRQVFTVRFSIFRILRSILAGIAFTLQLSMRTLITKLDEFKGVSQRLNISHCEFFNFSNADKRPKSATRKNSFINSTLTCIRNVNWRALCACKIMNEICSMHPRTIFIM